MDNNKNIRILILVLGILISAYVFGLTLAFLVSLIFILVITTRFLQDLDNKGLLTIVTVTGPIIKEKVGKICLAGYRYDNWLVGINDFFNGNHIPYTVTKEDIDALIIYAVIMFLVVLFSNNDTTAIGKHVTDGDPEFRRKSFKEKNDMFCSALSKRIERVNVELNWNDSLYIPIAAEVEMTKGKTIKRYDDMLKCLKKNRINSLPFIVKFVKNIRLTAVGKIRFLNLIFNTIISKYENKEVYLVLGDPGSGKSVSLRKLCTDLLKEAHITGKTAVYINLKTWTSNDKEWSDDNLPSEKDLIKFIREELYKDGDLFTDDFLNNYFEKMLNDGRWYFIFDSFDEMPCFMGKGKNNALIDHVSLLLSQFLSGPNQSGGIIASRIYHRPASSLNQTCTLRLQSFDDSRIRSMIKKYLVTDTSRLIKDLFIERNDLVNLCRNPFHLALLINYIKKQDYSFPKNQFDLFKDFIDERLNKSARKIRIEGFAVDEIYSAAIELSIIMQIDLGHGLEFPVKEVIKKSCLSIDWDKALSILEYIKICRFGGNKTTVSFVHRRFQEFFFVEGIMNNKLAISTLDYEGILSNTGIRDALVLYCQIGNEEAVQEISDYCIKAIEQRTEKISGVLNKESAELVNALYFITEAFINRKELIKKHLQIITNLRSYLKKNTDFIILMAIVNSFALLEPEDIQESILDVFRLNNRWINERIANNCSIIKRIDRRVERNFCRYFEEQYTVYLIKNYFNTDFSLSLSENFKYVKRVHRLLPFYNVINISVFLGGSYLLIFPLVKKVFDNIFQIFNTTKYHFDINMIIGSIRVWMDSDELPLKYPESTQIQLIRIILITGVLIRVC